MAKKKETPGDGDGNDSGQSKKDELLAGKFKDDDTGKKALVDAFLASEKKISELGERMKRAEETVSAFATAQAADPVNTGKSTKSETGIGKDLADRLFEDPESVLNEIFDKREKKMMKMISQVLNSQAQNKSAREKFYSKNPDLEKYASLVAIHADAVSTEKPGISTESAFEEVALRTRAEIAKIREDKGKPPGDSTHLGGGEDSDKPKPTGTGEGDEEKPLSPEEKLEDFVKERSDFKSEKMGVKPGGGDQE